MSSTDLVVSRPPSSDLHVPRRQQGPPRQKGPDSCENIGCIEPRTPGKNKCSLHLACQRKYADKYRQRKLNEQQALRTRNAELEQQNAALKLQNAKLQSAFTKLTTDKKT